MTKPKKKTLGHVFYLSVHGPRGLEKEALPACRVIAPKDEVVLTVKLEDVLRAKKFNGVGSTTHCTMACCVHRSRSLFSHPVGEMVDWQTSTVFIQTGGTILKPTQCARYYHDGSTIVRLNDTPGGIKKLMKMVDANGNVTIRLWHRKRNDKTKRIGSGKRDGTRSGEPHAMSTSRGARRRFANANQGYTPIRSNQSL